MERRDAVIGLIGALIVLVAAVGVGLAGGPPRDAFALTFPLRNVHLGEGNLAHFNEPEFHDAFPFDVPTNAAALFVNASVDFLGAPQASALATLVEPDGTRHDVEGALEVAPGQQRFTFAFSLPLREAPEPSSVPDVPPQPAYDQEGWTLEIGFASGLVPAASATTAWSADALTWEQEATPLVPPAR